MHAMDLVCFEEPFRFDRRAMRRFAEAGNALVVVAERRTEEEDCSREGSEGRSGEMDGGRNGTEGMLGFVIVHMERGREGRWGYVVTLDVLPTERRTGVARRLMGEAERQAAEAGARRMELDVSVGNEGAIRFYEGQGYSRTEVKRGFYGRVRGEAERAVSLDAFAYGKKLWSE